MIQRLIDLGVLGGLALALLLVVAIDRLLPTSRETEASAAPQATKMASQPSQPKELRLGVTRSQQDKKTGLLWDDMGKLLDSLGSGYKYKLLDARELLDAKRLRDFDVLFLTCAPGGAEINGVETAFAENLRNFVGEGGTIYASDWRYDAIEKAFPDIASPRLRGEGKAQFVDAEVVDPGLRDLVGPTLQLKFDLDRWKTAAFAGDRVKVLVEGNYERQQVGRARAPFLVKFQFGKGTVIFTSFHNEKQNSAIEQQLLKYLVFSAVTAQVESQVHGELIKGGFSPQKQNLLSASADNPRVSYTYRATKAGKIRFVLGFDDRGARLKMTVVSPAGDKTEEEGTKTFHIDAFNPGPGEWRYTVEALRVPFPDFPFTVTVAESE